MKVFISVVLSLICYIGVAQPPTPYKTPYNPLGGKNVMVNSTGGFIGDSTVVLPVYSDTLKANKSRTSLYPGSMIRVANDYYYRSADTTRWVLIATTNSNCGGTRLIDGSITWSGVGYIFNATVLHYGIICGLYTSDTTTLTVSPSDPTYPRIDVFYADTSGNVGIITGTPSPTPVKPSVNPLSQIEVSFVYVPAGSVTPPQTATIIYNENIEWAGASNVPSINFAYTINPYDGLVSTYFSSMASGTFISYQNGSVLNINNYQYLKFYFRRNSALGSDPASTLVLDFYNGNTLITNSLFINDGAYGYDASVIGSYQLIIVPISSFTFADSLFDKLYITNTTGSLSSCQLDKIYLLGSVPPPPVISNSWVRPGNANTNPVTDRVGTTDSTQLNIGANSRFDLIVPADGINFTPDSSTHILVRDPITNKLYWIYQPSIYALGCLKIYDSTSSGITRKYIRDTCSGGSGSSGWSLTGNAGTNPSTNFIGTTDAQDLVFKVNSDPAGLLSYNNTMYGYSGVNTGDFSVLNGSYIQQSGNFFTGIGYSAGNNNSGDSVVSVGAYAGRDNSKGRGVFVGFNSGYGNSGQNITAIGFNAGESNSKNEVILLGSDSYADSDNQFALSDNITTLKLSGVTGAINSGYVLTTNGSGIATFQPAAGGGGEDLDATLALGNVSPRSIFLNNDTSSFSVQNTAGGQKVVLSTDGASAGSGKISLLNSDGYTATITASGMNDNATLTIPRNSGYATVSVNGVASDIAGSISLTPTSGATGQTSYTTGDILYASASNTLLKLGIGSSKQALRVVSGVPAWRDTAALTLANLGGLGTGIATALAVNTGSAGAPVLFNGAGGTPSSLTLTNATGLPIAGTTGYGTGVATALAVATNAIGGMLTGASSFSANVLTVLSDFRPTKTITAAGTTGAQTINKTTGTVNFAAGATTLVVTNSFATANSVVIVTVYGTDATATSARVTKASGSFTITLNAAATAETAVGFMVTN